MTESSRTSIRPNPNGDWPRVDPTAYVDPIAQVIGKAETYFSWKMPVNEANDLVRWWEKEGMQIRKRQLPVVEHKFKSVLISMFTHASVDIRGFDQYGVLKLLGYSLPRKVVECLSVWMQKGQYTPKLNAGKDPK